MMRSEKMTKLNRNTAAYDDYMRANTPEEFQIFKQRLVKIGDEIRIFGYSPEMGQAAGYSDHEVIALLSTIVDPASVVENIIHECLHVTCPRWGEAKVTKTAGDVTKLIFDVLRERNAYPPMLSALKIDGATVQEAIDDPPSSPPRP